MAGAHLLLDDGAAGVEPELRLILLDPRDPPLVHLVVVEAVA